VIDFSIAGLIANKDIF